MKSYKHRPTGTTCFFILFSFFFLISATNLPAFQGDDSPRQDGQPFIPSFRPAGFIQQHFTADNIGENPADFSIYRARLGFAGNISEKISISFIVGAVEPPDRKPALVNALANFKIHPLFNITTGQFLVPFGIEGPEMIFLNPAIERSFPVRSMNHYRMFRDVGVMIHGESTFLSYSAAVLNGTGANVPEKIDAKDFVARAIFKLSPNLNAGVSLQTGRFSNDLGSALNRHRWAVHSEASFNAIFLRTEYMARYAETASGLENLNSHGGYFLAGYRYSDKINFIGRFEYYTPDTEVTARYKGVTLGGNYFISNRTRLSLNGLAVTHDGDFDDTQLIMNVQLQFVL